LKHHSDPRMHTAEHILNQVMTRFYNCGRCFNAHIERKKSKCDYRFDHPLSSLERSEIESRVNDVITADLQVTESYVPRSEADKHYNIEKLPDDAGDTIRIIKIGNYDACACIGEHVKSTAEIGSFRITSTSYEDGVLRIRFKLS